MIIVPSNVTAKKAAAFKGIGFQGYQGNNPSFALPAHVAGDIFFAVFSQAARADVITLPTASANVPAWVELPNTGGHYEMKVAYAVATTSGMVSGNWLTYGGVLNGLAVAVFSGSGIGSYVTQAAQSIYSTGPGITLADASGNSQVMYIHIGQDLTWRLNNALPNPIPAGYTNRIVLNDYYQQITAATKDVTTTAPAINVGDSSRSGRISRVVVEILA